MGAEGLKKSLETRAAYGQKAVDRWFQLDLPVVHALAPPDEPDLPKVHGMIAVDAEKPMGLEKGEQLAESPPVPEALRAPETDQCLFSLGLEIIHFLGIDGGYFQLVGLQKDASERTHIHTSTTNCRREP